jgi:hypothetical protein
MTKIMLLHGVLDEIQDHLTWWLVDGTWKTFKYAKEGKKEKRKEGA